MIAGRGGVCVQESEFMLLELGCTMPTGRQVGWCMVWCGVVRSGGQQGRKQNGKRRPGCIMPQSKAERPAGVAAVPKNTRQNQQNTLDITKLRRKNTVAIILPPGTTQR